MIRMAGALKKAVVAALVCVAASACSPDAPSRPQAAPASSPSQETSATATTAAATTTATCLGLSICTPPPPDAEGNPACNYRDGWEADPSGSGINVYYFREPSAAGAEQVTADVRLKDGTTASQVAAIDAGESFHRIQFPGIDKATVQEVLLNTSAGRCFVIGPDGS